MQDNSTKLNFLIYEEVEKVIQELNGTCLTLDEAVQNIMGDEYDSNNLSVKNCEQIDLEIFKCGDCDWWYEICEMSETEEDYCENCQSNE